MIPPQGVTDLGKANIYRHHDLISNVKEMLRTTKYSHNVVRYLPDRVSKKQPKLCIEHIDVDHLSILLTDSRENIQRHNHYCRL